MLNKIRSYSRYVLMSIEQIKQQIDSNPFHFKTSSQLIESFAMPNRNTLEKAFKDVYGAGIKEYQVRQRLEASKKLLEQGLTKKQVAARCYYSSQSAFAAAFKKAFNMTPTEWQLLTIGITFMNAPFFDNILALLNNIEAIFYNYAV